MRVSTYHEMLMRSDRLYQHRSLILVYVFVLSIGLVFGPRAGQAFWFHHNKTVYYYLGCTLHENDATIKKIYK